MRQPRKTLLYALVNHVTCGYVLVASSLLTSFLIIFVGALMFCKQIFGKYHPQHQIRIWSRKGAWNY